MKFFISLILFLSSACFSCAHLPGRANNNSVKDAYQSVARVSSISKDGKKGIFGSAFAIDDDHLMTAAHVCVAMYEGNVRGELPEKINVMFVYHKQIVELKQVLEIELIEEKTDVCILKNNPGLVPVKFADYSTIAPGDKIFTIGSPLSLFPVQTEGFVSIPKMDVGDGRELLFASLHISPGNSGGAIFNEQNEVVGMAIMAVVPHIFLVVDSPFMLGQRGDVLQRFAKIVKDE